MSAFAREQPVAGTSGATHTTVTPSEKLRASTHRTAEGAKGVAEEAPPSIHDVLRSPGQPLDPQTRAQFEPRLGHDFANVQVHANSAAARSARDIGAQAYTAGQHIAFAAGRYAPESGAGRRLIAHELAHVAQQRHAAPQARPALGSRSDAAEREADLAANAAMSGRRAELSGASDAAIIVRRTNGVPTPVAPSPPGWLGSLGSKATHIQGNVWDVPIPGLGMTPVGPYDELQAYLRTFNTSRAAGVEAMEAAHIIGGEHMRDLGWEMPYEKAPCVGVAESLHAKWTKEISNLQSKVGPMGGRATPKAGRPVVNSKDVIDLYDEVYKGFPELQEMSKRIVDLEGKRIMSVKHGMPAPKSPMAEHKGEMPKPKSPAEVPKATMPKPKSPMETPKATMPKPTSPMEAPKATMPKPKSPMEAPKATMPKPKSPMEVPKATMPKPQSPMEVPKATMPKPKSPMEVPKATMPKPGAPIEVPSKVPQGVPEPVPEVAVTPSVAGSAVKAAAIEIGANVLLFAVTYFLNKWHAEKQVKKFNDDLKGLLTEINTRLKGKEAEATEKQKAFPLVYGNITITYTHDKYEPDDYNSGSMKIEDVSISHQNFQTPERLVKRWEPMDDNDPSYSLTFSVPLFEEKAAEVGASSNISHYRAMRETVTYPGEKARLAAAIHLYSLAKQDASLRTLVIRDELGMLKDEDAMVRLAAATALRNLKAKIAIDYIRAMLSITSDSAQREIIQRYLTDLEHD